MFLGLRDFRTASPEQLRSDLQRHNVLIEQAFGALESACAQRWLVVRSAVDVRAKLSQAIHLDATTAVKVFLPSSNPDSAGRCVRVARRTGSAAITVVANALESVNGAVSVSWTASTKGWHEFMADGAGGWLSELF